MMGCRLGISLAAGFLVLGMWVKTLSYYNFWFLILGQTIAAVANPLMQTCPTKISGTWFGAKERNLATTIAQASTPIGAIIG